MSAVFGRRAGQRAVLAIALFAAIGAAPAFADNVSVSIDQAHVLHLPDKVATIVIGNPLIADASLQKGGILVITGKSYGSTNLVALDRGGQVVMDKTVEVRSAAGSDLVVVYRGVERETYSCAPECERRITLGDSPAYFGATLAQSGSRNGQASSGAQK